MSNNPYIGARVVFDTERSVTGPFTGIAQNLGTPLTSAAVLIIMDNQSSVAVQVVVNGNVWKTFSAGEALVLDLRGNAAHAATFAADANTQFQVIGTAGAGIFSLSVLYAR